MQVAEVKTSSSASPSVQARRQPFFSKEGEGGFFSDSKNANHSFFGTNIIQQKCSNCEIDSDIIQKQNEPEATITEELSPDPEATSTSNPISGPSRADRCYTNPEFPNFRCLAYALKLDIDENLYNNAHQFYRVATLYPDDNDLMWRTFLRYGLGANLLNTSFGFLGADETLASVLTYSTGIGLKSFDFFQNGVLQLDIPIPITPSLTFEIQGDLITDPNNYSDVQEASAGVGFSGHF